MWNGGRSRNDLDLSMNLRPPMTSRLPPPPLVEPLLLLLLWSDEPLESKAAALSKICDGGREE